MIYIQIFTGLIMHNSEGGASFADLLCYSYLSLAYCHVCFLQPWGDV